MSKDYSKLNHILKATIEKDLYDTQVEIFSLQSEINDRKDFITKLENILSYRKEKENETQDNK